MPGIGPEGDRYFIRGEYVDSDQRLEDDEDDEDDDLKDDDEEEDKES